MPTTSALQAHHTDDGMLISLAGVAALADVQRPVVSMWRSRLRESPHPFPAPVSRRDGREFFDAAQVAEWLVETGHGNNEDAVLDAAAYAAPADVDLSDSEHVAELTALVALRAATGELLVDTELSRTAHELDPADEFFAAEVATAASRPRWPAYVDALVDACYSPAAAIDRIEARAVRSSAADASAGPLAEDAVDLLGHLIAALATSRRIAPVAGVDAGILQAIIALVGDDLDIEWPAGPMGRALRRRALADGILPSDPPPPFGERTVLIGRFPTAAGQTPAQMLRDIDEFTLELSADDAAVVMAPARVLVDELAGEPDSLRAGILRGGRLSAVVLLPRGLVASATREALALWIFGPATGVALGDRVTAVADVSDAGIGAGDASDLVSDILAALDGPRHARARAFRFARLVRTSSLLAGGPLVQPVRRAAQRRHSDLAVTLDAAIDRAGADAPPLTISAGQGATAPPKTVRVADAVAGGNVRMIAGLRLDESELTEDGHVVVTVADLADPDSVGTRRVDRLAFAAAHPSASLTRPGDVVFCTAPKPRAWVDVEGSSVVAAPARVLRISPHDPGGLVPEVVASDIRHGATGAHAWRDWMLRTVDPLQGEATRAALQRAEQTRADLRRRIAALDTLADALADAVSASAVTLTRDLAADAASEER